MKLGLLPCLAFIVWALFGCSTAPQSSETANPLSLSIALLDSPFNNEIYVDIHTNCHFHVVITNDSKKPQNVLKEGCSWGYEALSFELIDEHGNKSVVRRTPAIWTDNGPAYWILKPGEQYVRDVCFAQVYQGQNSWDGFPTPLKEGRDLKVKMKAIFELTGSKDPMGAPLWHGRIESQWITCRIRDIRSLRVEPPPYDNQ